MGRKPSWPPNSAAEWIIGQNFCSWDRKPAYNRNTILRVELSENEVSCEDTLAITYPRIRNRSGSAKAATPVEGSSSTRRVRFGSSGEPLKSALKKPSEDDSEDTLVQAAGEDADTPTEEESSGINDTDTSEEESLPERKNRRRRRRRRRPRRPKMAVCLKEAELEESSADKDAVPHPTCPCAECSKGRMIMKAVIKAEAKLRAAEEKAKAKHEAEEADPSSSEAVDTSETQAETTDGRSTEEEAPKPKKGKKHKSMKKKSQPATGNKTEESSSKAGIPKTVVNKTTFKLPKYPKELRPKLIMPTRTRVVQIEHTVESPNDPAPNAFFDSKKGITRVYHGPKWGNLKAELYGKTAGSTETKENSGDSALAPDSAPPPPPPPPPPAFPMSAPWQAPYPPPYWIPPPPPEQPAFHWAKTATAAPAHLHEDSLKEAAARGLGLSDMSAPKAPSATPKWQAPTLKTASPNAGSDKESKKNGWNNPVSKEAIPKSPFDFTGFGGANGDIFSRKSNQSGSKKSGSVDGRKPDKAKAGGWRDSNNDDKLGTGAWAASSSNKNGEWKAPESNGDNTWGNNQNTTWENGEKAEHNSWGNKKTAAAWGNESKSGDKAWGNNQNTTWGDASPNGRSPKTPQKGDGANVSKAGSNSDSGLGQGVFGLPDGFPPGLSNGTVKIPGAMPDSGENASWGGGGGQW